MNDVSKSTITDKMDSMNIRYELKNACVGLFGVLLLIFGTRLSIQSCTRSSVWGICWSCVDLGTVAAFSYLDCLCSVIGVVLMLLVENWQSSCVRLLEERLHNTLPYYFGFPRWYWVIVGRYWNIFAPVFPSSFHFGCPWQEQGVYWAVNNPEMWSG